MLDKSWLLVSATAISLVAPNLAYADDGITGINAIPGTLPTNLGAGFNDISGDGSTLAGVVRTGVSSYRPYVFTLEGKTALPIPAGDDVGHAKGISSDGKVIVGYSAVDPYSHSKALVWRNGLLT